MGTNYFPSGQRSVILNYWPLAVEEQFYFTFQLLVSLIGAICTCW